MTRLLLSILAGIGVSLLILDRLRRDASDMSALRRRAGRAATVGALTAIAAAGTWLLIGSPLASLAAAAASLLAPPAIARREARLRVARLSDAWPRMLDETRVLCGPGGLSLAQALFTAGRSASSDLRPAWAAAEVTWRLSSDLAQSLHTVEQRLPDPTTRLICSTLDVIHTTGGATQHEQLGRLVADRRRDAATRRTAESELAGARFTRRFVLIVPLGMAVAGRSVGTGQAAFASASGQLAVLFALSMVGACWVWSGRLLRVPMPGEAQP